MRDQLREFANEVTQFFEEAEKIIASHPAQSVIGALLIGILIGRLLRDLKIEVLNGQQAVTHYQTVGPARNRCGL